MEPNTLYITISLPNLPPYQPLSPDFYRPYLTSAFNPRTYETSIAATSDSNATEEFNWGIYWINHLGIGTLYTLHRVPQPAEDSPLHALQATIVPPTSIRFDNTIIGFLKVLTLPPGIQDGMQGYITWLTALTAPAATRTFIWATTTYARCRKHTVHTIVGVEDDESEEFEINGFLEEALGLTYGDVRHALMGRGCVPVWTSEYGVEVVEEEEELQADEMDDIWLEEEGFDKNKKQEESKQEVVDFDTAWPRLSDVYPV